MTSQVLKQGRENWYRNEIWSFKIECAFLDKLRRTRGQGSQCLAIQIGFLADTHPQDSLRLATLYFDEWSDPFHDGQVHRSKAQAFIAMKQFDEAAESLAEALDWQQQNPNHIVGAELAFGMLVAEHDLSAWRDQAQDAVLRLDPATLLFPLERFRRHAVLAMIAEAKGDKETMEHHAQGALREAACEKSPFTAHPDLGLVSADAAPLVSRLRLMSRSAR